MLRTRKSNRLVLVAGPEAPSDTWASELRSCGILVELAGAHEPIGSIMDRPDPVLLLEPAENLLFDQQFAVILSGRRHPVFVVSDNDAWRRIVPEISGFVLGSHTHPLELGRLLVEKLNLSVTKSRSSYAFPFFQF